MEYYNGVLFILKKKEILKFATTWVNLESIMLNEICQAEKDKYCIVSLIWRMFLKVKLKNQRIEKWSSGVGGGENRERLVKGYKFPMINKV